MANDPTRQGRRRKVIHLQRHKSPEDTPVAHPGAPWRIAEAWRERLFFRLHGLDRDDDQPKTMWLAGPPSKANPAW